MLPVSYLRQEQAKVRQSLQKRHFKDETLLDRILAQDDQRRSLQKQLDETLAQSNQLAKTIGQLYKEGKAVEAEAQKQQATALRDTATQLKTSLDETEAALELLLLQMPNCLNAIVVPGINEQDNEVYQAWEQAMPDLAPNPLPHWELATKYQIIDFELGTKITGPGFPVYRGKGAKLQRALINFFLDEAEKAGYQEHMAPLLVNKDSARGTGQYPDKDAQMYFVERDDLFLIPTAEVPLTNIFRDVILEESDLPIKITGYTPCFRREAGSYGAHVRGLNRLHQFDKIEIVRIEKPEDSGQALMEMLDHVRSLLQKLELPYRILRLCGGDTGFASSLTYDFETYCAAQGRWLEVSSVSNFEIFQSTRLKLRYRNKDKKMETAHTLNGSALALPRILATLLENNQTEKGIKIPAALQPYFGAEYLD
jgi:seryl-tRNA synthetase